MEYRQSVFGKEVAAKICQHSEEQKIVEVILVKKQKGKSRATHVAGDMRKRRLQSLLRVCVALLLPTLYLFYCLSGLYIIDVEMTKLKEQIVWCLLHPLKIYNDKSLSMVFVVGGSGAGKNAFFLTPNLLSLHDCNIYTDPKGSLVEELGAWLSEQRDTRVYTLNLCEMEKSMHFNPFLYIRSKSDVTKLVTNLIQNTNSPNIKNSSADPFWESATCS